MKLIEIILIAISLSMDAFAVSMCKGLEMKKINHKHALIIALFFGLFQALMPLIGYFLGTSFEKYITSFDHWIAFALLSIIGGKMIFDSFHKEEIKDGFIEKLNIKELFVLAIATSIDALAVGITFAFLKDTNITLAVSLIGVITFALSYIGVILGNKIGIKFKSKAELLGGIVLILIGIKILLEHLNIITF